MGETEVDKPIEHLFDELGEHIVGYARRQSTPYDIVAIGNAVWREIARGRDIRTEETRVG